MEDEIPWQVSQWALVRVDSMDEAIENRVCGWVDSL